jgi:arylsulfatase A-like enzyme
MDNTSLIDIPPTAAAVMGIEPHPEWDGRVLINR